MIESSSSFDWKKYILGPKVVPLLNYSCSSFYDDISSSHDLQKYLLWNMTNSSSYEQEDPLNITYISSSYDEISSSNDLKQFL